MALAVIFSMSSAPEVGAAPCLRRGPGFGAFRTRSGTWTAVRVGSARMNSRCLSGQMRGVVPVGWGCGHGQRSKRTAEEEGGDARMGRVCWRPGALSSGLMRGVAGEGAQS